MAIVKGEIGNALKSVAPDGIVATADAIYDETKGKSQERINEENEGSLVAQYHNTGYYECATAAATAAKVIAGSGYKLPSTAPYGGCIKVKFAHANSAANPTLSINGSPAKPLYYDGSIASSTNTWADNETVDIYYDGTNFYANNVAGGGTFTTGEKVKNVGIDAEPTAGSDNLVKSGGAYKLKSDKAGLYQHELLIKGEIQPLDVFEIGNIEFSDSGFTYKYRDYRVRTKKNSSIYLSKDNVISIEEGYRFYIGYYDEEGLWYNVGWKTTYTVPENGSFFILIEKFNSQTAVTSPDELSSKLSITTNGINPQIKTVKEQVDIIEKQVSKREFTVVGSDTATQTETYNFEGNEKIRITFKTRQWSIANLGNGASYVWINIGDRQILNLKKANDAIETDTLEDNYDIIPLSGETSVLIGIRADIGEEIHFEVVDFNYSVVDDVLSLKNRQDSTENIVEQLTNQVDELEETNVIPYTFTLVGANGATQIKSYDISGNKNIRIVPKTKQWSIANLNNDNSYFWINVGERTTVNLKKANDATITTGIEDYYDIIPQDGETTLTINIRGDVGEEVPFEIVDLNHPIVENVISLENRQAAVENAIDDLNFVSLNLSVEDLEQGNIRLNSNGTLTYNSTDRVRLKQGKTVFIPKGTLIYFPQTIIRRYYVYWKEIGSELWASTGSWIITSYFVTTVSGEYTFLFDTPYTEERASQVALFFIAQKNVTIDNIKSIQKEQSFGNVTYYGRRICLNKRAETHRAYIEKLIEVEYGSDGVNPLVATQSSAVYNDLMFVFLDTSISWSGGILCKIFSLTTKSFVGDIINNGTIPSAHCNGAVFSTIFYDANDEFPLLLLSSGSSGVDNWLKICRIISTETEGVTTYSITVVKTITYDTNTLTHTHFMTSAIDEINDCLWVYGYNTSETSASYAEHWFYKFPLPNLKDNIDITLTNDDVINVLKYPYRVAGQAFQVYKGRAYMAGLSQNKFPDLPSVNPARNVTVLNLTTGEIENMVPSIDTAETEGISVYNGALYVSSRVGGTEHESTDIIFHITKWTFEQEIPSP